MRLDHLLSKGKSKGCITVDLSRGNSCNGWRRGTNCEAICNDFAKQRLCFRWRCVWGTHPFPSRTRRLRLRRPMVLYWRRYGRAGGCRIILKNHIYCRNTSIINIYIFSSDRRGKSLLYKVSFFMTVKYNSSTCTLKTEYRKDLKERHRKK